MAKYNEILVGRFNRGLQKLFGIKGDAPVPTLSGEVSPSHVLQSGAENRYLEGWNLFGDHLLLGPSVGNNNGVRLRNPATSGVIAVITKVLVFTTGTVDSFTISRATTGVDLTNLFLPTPFDIRYKTSGGSALSLSGFSPAADLAFVIARMRALADTMVELINHPVNEMPLLPGDCYSFTNSLINATTGFSLFWRERILEDSEKS
jgi:hypothetical protein